MPSCDQSLVGPSHIDGEFLFLCKPSGAQGRLRISNGCDNERRVYDEILIYFHEASCMIDGEEFFVYCFILEVFVGWQWQHISGICKQKGRRAFIALSIFASKRFFHEGLYRSKSRKL